MGEGDRILPIVDDPNCGHAVAAHGEPRLTEDLDVFVELSPENAENLQKALIEFGIGPCALLCRSATPPCRENVAPHENPA